MPYSFCRGLLVPVMKKANLDPTECKSYRPITVSSVISKMISKNFLSWICVLIKVLANSSLDLSRSAAQPWLLLLPMTLVNTVMPEAPLCSTVV